MNKKKVTLLGQEMDVTEIDIVEKKDRAAEYTLEDGSIIRFTAVPTSVIRVEGQCNQDGTPIYLVLNQGVVTVIHAPAHLMKPQS